MNWYKIAQYSEEPPVWEFPEADHDYNPSWDYEQVIPDENLKVISEQIIDEINTKLVPEIGMGRAKTAYIKDNDEALARYVYGTAPYPVFVIDLEAIKSAAEELVQKWGGDIDKEIHIGIRTTLFHELGHAIQDWMGLELDENEAEDFGIRYHETGQIYNFWEDDELV